MNNQGKNQAFLDDFATSAKVGEVGETAFIAFMKANWPAVKVEDVSGNDDYRWKDIDFILHYPSGKKVTVEVKTDTNDWSPNFAMEVVANQEKGRKGWFVTSEADVLAYLFVNGLKGGGNNLFIMNLNEARNVVSQHECREVPAKTESQIRGEGKKTTIVKLVHRSLLTRIMKTYKIAPQNVTNSHSAQAGWK